MNEQAKNFFKKTKIIYLLNVTTLLSVLTIVYYVSDKFFSSYFSVEQGRYLEENILKYLVVILPPLNIILNYIVRKAYPENNFYKVLYVINIIAFAMWAIVFFVGFLLSAAI